MDLDNPHTLRPVTLSHKEQAKSWDNFPRKKPCKSGRQMSVQPVTRSIVREEAARILDAFLKKKQDLKWANSMHGRPPIGRAYQRVSEITVTEPDPLHAKSSNNNTAFDKSVLDALADETIPFADETLDNSKSSSLPHDFGLDVRERDRISPASKSDGGTPKSHKVSVTAENYHSKGVDTSQSVLSKSSRRSGSLTDSDKSTSSESAISPDRKKKSVFKRAKERFLRALHKQKEFQEHEEKIDKKEKEKKPIKPKKKKQKKSQKKANHLNKHDNYNNSIEVLEETRTHTKTHIKQTVSNGGGDNSVVLRQESTSQSIDYVGPDEKKCKHTEKHKNVKESSDSGFFGKLRRLTSRRKSKKELDQADYDRKSSNKSSGKSVESEQSVTPVTPTAALPVSPSTEYAETTTSSSPQGIQTHHVQVSAWDAVDRGTSSSQGKVSDQSDTLPFKMELDGEGGSGTQTQLQQASSFYGLEPYTEGPGVPGDKPFEMDIEYDVTKQKIKTSDGQLKTEIDVVTHQHMTLGDGDLVTDGLDDMGHAGGDPQAQSEKSSGEKEELYSKIAERLMAIGDGLAERSLSAATSPTSPTSPTDASGIPVPVPDTIVPEEHNKLNSVEAELRDCLRSFGDEISQRYTIPDGTTEMAAEIVRQAAYGKFSDVVQGAIGNEVGWNQLAMVFTVTKKAVNLAGAGGALAYQIKDMSLRYIEDKFAGWIVGQGGWDSMLSESSDIDSELD